MKEFNQANELALLTRESEIRSILEEKRTSEYDKWVLYGESLPERMTTEEAVTEAGLVNLWIDNHDVGGMVGKFFLGIIAYRANPEWRTRRAYGEDIIGNMSKAKGINPNILREARRVAEFFGFDLPLYYRWVTEKEGKPKRWYDAQNLIRAFADPDVHGPENLGNILANQVMTTAMNLQELREMAQRGEVEWDEVRGVEATFLEEIQAFRASQAQEQLTGDTVETARPETPRDSKFLEKTRERPCPHCGQSPSEAHHIEQGGTGMRGSDYAVIPVCRELHDFIEDKGHRAAEEAYGINIAYECLRNFHIITTGKDVHFPPDLTRR